MDARIPSPLVNLAEEARAEGHGSPVYVPGSGGENLTAAETGPLPEAWDSVPHLKGRPKGE